MATVKPDTWWHAAIPLNASEQKMQGAKFCAGEKLGKHGDRVGVYAYGDTPKQVADTLRAIADEIERKPCRR